MKRPVLALALTTLGFGCREATSYPGFDAAVDAPALDAPSADAGADVMRADSGCPAPARITPEMIPADYLPVQRATYIRSTDGDTAHFALPIVGETTVRFLWVNTEESSGDERTAFGAYTSQQVARIMAAGAMFQVARHRASAGSSEPELDQFGRTLALVFMDGELLQTRLVREGWTAYYTAFGCPTAPLHQTLLLAEAEARANRLGIWAPNHPTNYATVFAQWIGTRGCRPNPFRNQPYCN
ncbi:MAG: thermonuclease family protein [Polyangiales bacterium]